MLQKLDIFTYFNDTLSLIVNFYKFLRVPDLFYPKITLYILHTLLHRFSLVPKENSFDNQSPLFCDHSICFPGLYIWFKFDFVKRN